MIWLWIIGGIVLLLTAVALIPLGLRGSFGDALRLEARIGWIRLTLMPSPEKTSGKKGNLDKDKEAPKPKKRLKLTFAELREGSVILWTAAKKALKKTRRHVKIHPFSLSVTFGGSADPPQTAELYGWADTAVWTVMPQLERLTRMPDPHVHLGVDYQSDLTRVQGKIGVSLRLGALLVILLTFGIPAVRWYVMLQKTREERKPVEEQTQNDKGE